MKIKFFGILVLAVFSCKTTNNASLLNVADFSERSSVTGSGIIDVRSPEEYNEGYIKGAVNIDFNGANFENEISRLDKNSPYFIYCLSGSRSNKAMEKMQAAGFKNTYGLDGGIKAWKEAKMPLETASTQSADTTQKPFADVKDPTDFKTAIYGDKLVFVDFNATWCGPCKRMQPFVDMIKEERSSEVIVFSIDTDEQAQLAQEYQIVNLPTVMLIKKGSVLYRQEGYQDQASLNALVTKFK